MSTNQSGFGMLELILVIGLFAVIGTAAITSVLGSFGINRLADQQTEATLYAQEGIEAVTSLRNRDWDNLATGTYGLTITNNLWQFSGSSDTQGNFTRAVTLENVYRDSNYQIATSGGTLDEHTYKLTSEVDWSSGPGRNNQVSLATYLTNYHKTWENVTAFATINLPLTQDTEKLKTRTNYIYGTRQGNPFNFYIIDITNLNAAFEIGHLAIDGVGRDLVVDGNYAYIASGSDTQELQIINVSVVAAPVLVGTLNLPGTQDGVGIYKVNNIVYLTRTSGTDDEFFTINVSNPLSPTVIGSMNLDQPANEVWAADNNYAYVASSSNTQELIVVDVNPAASPTQVTSLDLAGNNNAVTIDGGSGFVVLGRSTQGQDSGFVHVVDISTPTSPLLEGSYNSGASIADLAVGRSDQAVFLATNNPSIEFQIVDISDHSNPLLFSALNAGDDLVAMGYNSDRDLAVAGGSAADEEFIVYGAE